MELIDKPTANFIREHRNDDVRKLAFASDKYPSVDMPLALDQIQGWQTARTKLPSWAAIDGIIYPPHLNMEQCSSEQTARYKTSLCPPGASPDPSEGGEMEITSLAPSKFNKVTRTPSLWEGWGGCQVGCGCQVGSIIDLTGGFGVDFSFMSRQFKHAIYVEQNPRLCEIAKHNFKLLGLTNAEVVNGDGVEFLKNCPKASVIYLDPARRDSHGNRVYNISDCQPDVVKLAPLLLEKAQQVIVKLSPMFDWHEAVWELPCVKEVHIVSVKNECKEMIIKAYASASPDPTSPSPSKGGWQSQGGEMKITSLARGDGNGKGKLYCVNDEEMFVCSFEEASAQYSTVEVPYDGEILLVPNSSIMKAGCFAAVANRFGVRPIGRNSHLFVADKQVEAFPGRQFKILAVSSMNKKELRRNLSGIKKANISVRNFPMSVDTLRKRLKIGDGGDVYIFATTVSDGTHVLIISKKLF